jgi:hypothetical protein
VKEEDEGNGKREGKRKRMVEGLKRKMRRMVRGRERERGRGYGGRGKEEKDAVEG